MDFHRFPFGFDGDDQAARHEDLVRYLQVRSMRTAQQRPPSVNSKRFQNVQSVFNLDGKFQCRRSLGSLWPLIG